VSAGAEKKLGFACFSYVERRAFCSEPGSFTAMSRPATFGKLQNNSDLSAARSFISEYITTAEQLDVLLLLHSEPSRDFTAAEVSQRIYTVPSSATARLEELITLGLAQSDLEADPRYQYAPATPALGGRVDALAAAYRVDRAGVIRLIFAQPTTPAQAFADAFRLRRPEG
jgi:hypothetical protein